MLASGQIIAMVDILRVSPGQSLNARDGPKQSDYNIIV